MHCVGFRAVDGKKFYFIISTVWTQSGPEFAIFFFSIQCFSKELAPIFWFKCKISPQISLAIPGNG